MLRREHNRINTNRLVIFIANCHLAFGIWAQPPKHLVMAKFCLFAHELMRISDWGWHKHICFMTGITKHHTLIARALLMVRCLINTLRYVRWLFTNSGQNSAWFPIKAHIWTVITDIFNNAACDVFYIDPCVCRNFTRNNHHAGFNKGLTSNTCIRIRRYDRI